MPISLFHHSSSSSNNNNDILPIINLSISIILLTLPVFPALRPIDLLSAETLPEF
jgi:hypothetical protein